MEHDDLIALLREVQANQLSLHDDMAAVINRLDALQKSIEAHVQSTPEASAVDMHQQYLAARTLVVETGSASTSMLQRVLRVGYSRAAALIYKLEENNVIGPHNDGTPREVFLDRDALSEIEEEEENGPMPTGDTDELYDEAVAAVREAGKCSVSYLQRKFRIDYSRAAFLQGLLEKNGVVGPANGAKPRAVL